MNQREYIDLKRRVEALEKAKEQFMDMLLTGDGLPAIPLQRKKPGPKPKQ